MKKSEIIEGGRYSNLATRQPDEVIREVVAFCGPSDRLQYRQDDQDCVRYRVVHRGAGPNRVGYEAVMTRARFANWAKSKTN